MASNESHAYEIMRELDVDYVLVIFGGLISYSSDGKFFLCLCIPYMLYQNIDMGLSFIVRQSILTFFYSRYQQILVDGPNRRKY